MVRGIPEPLKFVDVMKLFRYVTARGPDEGMTRLEAFWTYVEIKDRDECWPWQGYLRNGYGVFRLGKQYRVNRLMWVLYNMKDLQGDDLVLHHCDNPPCCNPYHIYKGDKSDNIQDAWNRNRMPDDFDDRVSAGRLSKSSKHRSLVARKARIARGDKVPDKTQLDTIRRLYKSGKYTQSQLGDMFGIGQFTVSRIIRCVGIYKFM